MEEHELNKNFIDEGTPFQPKRPQFLTVLCILTFISTGMDILSGFPKLFGGPMSAEQMEDQKLELAKSIDQLRELNMESMAVMIEKLERMLDGLNAQFYASTSVALVVLMAGLSAAILMWMGRKIGFHVYIAYSLISAMQVYLFVTPSDIPSIVVILNLLVSGLFIFMYSRNLKWLH
jgi:hypothetical protein